MRARTWDSMPALTCLASAMPKVGEVDIGGEGFVAQPALGLQAAEFGYGSVHDAKGLCAGSVNGGLNGEQIFIVHGVAYR